MARTGAIHSYGTVFQHDFDDNGTYTSVVEVTKVSASGHSAEMIDATHLASDDRYKEFVKGFVDGGTLSIEGNLLPLNATQRAVLTNLQDTEDPLSYKLLMFGDVTKTMTFDGLTQDMNFDFNLNDVAKFSATFKVTGKPVFSS